VGFTLQNLRFTQHCCWGFKSHNVLHCVTGWVVPDDSKMSRPRCAYINNRCRYQSITQQYLKRCLIKDDNNYMFRPIAAIIRFLSKSMVVVLYRIGMVMSRWWDLNICDVCYMLLLRDTQVRRVICDVRYPGVYSSNMSARCCPMWVSSYCLSISDVYCWWAFAMGCACTHNP